MGGGDSVTLPGNMSNTAAAPSLAQSTYRGDVRKALSAMGMGRNGSAGAGLFKQLQANVARSASRRP